MRKFRISFTIASLVCLAALSSSGAAQEPERARIHDVELCDLLKSASRYKNRIVRLRAVYSSWFDVFFRYLPGANTQPDGSFNNFQTELTITGKTSQSKEKAFGIHGGYAYLFTIATVEKIGTTHIHDLVTGKTTVYIPETSEQRQARRTQEAAMVCESIVVL